MNRRRARLEALRLSIDYEFRLVHVMAKTETEVNISPYRVADRAKIFAAYIQSGDDTLPELIIDGDGSGS